MEHQSTQIEPTHAWREHIRTCAEVGGVGNDVTQVRVALLQICFTQAEVKSTHTKKWEGENYLVSR